MMVVRSRDIPRLDADAAASGTPTDELMQRAGKAVAATALRLQPELRRVTVLAGSGNNGGDGYVAALELHQRGIRVDLLEVSETPSSEVASAARDRLKRHAPNLSIAPALAPGHYAAEEALHTADLIIDALLGVGANRPVNGELAQLFARVRAAAAPILAVDVPSGLHADRADIPAEVLTATWTLQLGAAKPASFLAPAKERYGAWWIDDLGLEPQRVARFASAEAIGRTRAGQALPRRRSDAHKYRAGAVLVVGGSHRYAGAAELAARAAYRAGAGYVSLTAPERHPNSWPEIVAVPWGTPWACANADVAVVGPGLEVETISIGQALPDWGRRPLVLDGGALQPTIVKHVAGPKVLTPHAGEAAHLLNSDAETVAADPLAAAQELARGYQALVVLKGPSTVVADPSGATRIASGAPSALAVAGTGDVLAGCVGAVWAAAIASQRKNGLDNTPQHNHSSHPANGNHNHHTPLIDLVSAAVVLHAEAAHVALARLSDDGDAPSGGLIASDVLEALPMARARLERAARSA
jgi:hydroxyethylthiazole kinase-like uncharacterized protein yjeF